MGCCWSKESEEPYEAQNPVINERTPLLIDSTTSNPRPMFSNDFETDEPAVVRREDDESSTVNKILKEISRNVIDITNMETVNADQLKYPERQKSYSNRVAVVSSRPGSNGGDLISICNTSVCSVLSEEVTSLADRILISDSAKQVATAFSAMEIKNKKPLVVEFDSLQ